MSPSCPLGSYSEDRIRSSLFSYAKNQGKTLAWWRFVHWILRQTGGALSLWYGDDFHSHANKTHFYKKGCALGLILKVKVFGTQKWPIAHNMLNRNTVTIPREYLHVTFIKLQKKVHKCVSYLDCFKVTRQCLLSAVFLSAVLSQQWEVIGSLNKGIFERRTTTFPL